MIAWFNAMTVLQKIYVIIAFPATLIFLLQTILLLIGIGDQDVDSDGLPDAVGDDGLALFSLRGILAMLAIGGWSGVFFVDIGMTPVITILLSLIVGLAALFGCALLIKLILKMQSNGNIQLSNAIGKVGQVYIPIPPLMTGSGKINVTIQEKYSEISAMTNETDTIKTGEMVRVVATDEVGSLIVERVAKPASVK